MLYNRAYVEHRRPVTDEQVRLAQKHHPFRMGRKGMEELRSYLGSSLNHPRRFDRLEDITAHIHAILAYDEAHQFQGTRTALETWNDEKGHCIEQSILLYVALGAAGFHPRWLMTKNPKGYVGEGLTEFGVHPFVLAQYGGRWYRADAIGGSVTQLEQTGLCVTQQDLSFREFVSFYHHDAAEDLGLNHQQYAKALRRASLALRIDPNNYPVHVLQGDVYNAMKDYGRAEHAYMKAIRIAPNLVDTLKTLGNFYHELGMRDRAVKVYEVAVQKTTADLQVLRSLGEKLLLLREFLLFRRVNRMEEQLAASDALRGYGDGADNVTRSRQILS